MEHFQFSNAIFGATILGCRAKIFIRKKSRFRQVFRENQRIRAR